MIETITGKGMEMVPTPGQPKADSSPAARQKDRTSGRGSKGPVILNPNPASIQMLIAFAQLNYRVYEGSVPASVVRRRRKRNKMARISRRINRD
jgi:hypothetical protein